MVEFESWWLLAIPVFFGLGWLAARLDLRQARHAERNLPDAYFRGLNFLLNEQPDRAIDAFIEVVKLDPETIELHFALGNLFRRRGETDRAIRVHQNLVDRPGLSDETRARALFALGQDFQKAGLLDRAEAAFSRLESTPDGEPGPHASEALRHRLEIAQVVRDWPLAIALAQRLDGDTTHDAGTDARRLIAHFHCELAQAALSGREDDRLARAGHELDAALAIDPGHPRAWLLRGEALLARDDAAGALAAFERLAEASPAHLALAATPWLEAHRRLDRLGEGLARLEALNDTHPSVDLTSAVAEARAARDGLLPALQAAETALRRQPSLLGLDRLLELRLAALDQAGGDDATRRDELELTRRLIHAQARRLSRFVCADCGFKARQFHWQCPGCNRWDRYAPRRGEELDIAA